MNLKELSLEELLNLEPSDKCSADDIFGEIADRLVESNVEKDLQALWKRADYISRKLNNHDK